ncbi:MAG: STAS domain-containing protein [bacterium]|nr:STAS domain-containing protein [bacterium]
MKKSIEIDPVPFHNKIFFCDIIGYSKLEPINQYECHAQLTRIIRSCLDKFNAKLLEDVIALPTGDGLILNYIKAEPDIHLKTALMVLDILSKYNKNTYWPIQLRIGLNTNVDSIVIDVNNKKNIVGKGINLAERITNLSTHGRILMHKRVYEDLSNYKKYDGKFVYLGDFTVKHNVVIPIFQYVDAHCHFLDNNPLQKPEEKASTLTLSDIRKSRVKESILSIKLKGYDQDYFEDLHDYLEEFFDSQHIFENTKIAVNWIANEMLDNVFKHGNLSHDDDVFLRLDRVKSGIMISTEQPDKPQFNVKKIDSYSEDHFLTMLRKKGITVNVLHSENRMTISCMLPSDFQIRELKMLDIEDDSGKQPSENPSFKFEEGDIKELSASISYVMLDNGICFMKIKDKMYQDEAVAFKEYMQKLIDEKIIDFIIDLSELTYICSSGIANLLNYYRAVRREGGTIIYVNPNEKIREIFSMCKLDQILQLSKSLDDALAYFQMFY